MSENEQPKFNANNNSNSYNENSIEKCANLMSSSFYKTQLGINSCKDELRNLVEVQTAILGELEKMNEKK